MVVVVAARLPGEPRRTCAPHRVHDPVLIHPVDYALAVGAFWGTDLAIVNVEHDHPLTPKLVGDLLACPHPLCTHAYLMHIPCDYYAHSRDPGGNSGAWIVERDEWAAWSGIGFCKITPQARLTDTLPVDHWRGVEIQVNQSVRGPFHVHWPAIPHHHYR